MLMMPTIKIMMMMVLMTMIKTTIYNENGDRHDNGDCGEYVDNR